MGIGCHDVEALYRLDIEQHIGSISVAAPCVGEDKGIRIGISVIVRINVAVVRSVELCPAGIVLDIPVLHCDSGHGLVVDELSSDAHRERRRECIVKGEGCLPYLRHLELRVNGIDVS